MWRLASVTDLTPGPLKGLRWRHIREMHRKRRIWYMAAGFEDGGKMNDGVSHDARMWAASRSSEQPLANSQLYMGTSVLQPLVTGFCQPLMEWFLPMPPEKGPGLSISSLWLLRASAEDPGLPDFWPMNWELINSHCLSHSLGNLLWAIEDQCNYILLSSDAFPTVTVHGMLKYFFNVCMYLFENTTNV